MGEEVSMDLWFEKLYGPLLIIWPDNPNGIGKIWLSRNQVANRGVTRL